MEGPSLVILKEELQPFLGKRVLRVTGNTQQPKELLRGRVLSEIDTWAKVLFLEFRASRKKDPPIVTKTHFMMFGSYRIDDPKPNRVPRLELRFKNGTVYFYSCSLRFDGDVYRAEVDREVDLLSPHWNGKHVLERMAAKKDAYLCDLLLDQSVFAGSGNIVKNEVLFNIRRHPLTKLSAIPKKDWPNLVRAVREYCFNFYEWKKKYELRRHWQVYRKNTCPLCGRKLRKEKLGKFSRKTFYCAACQKRTVSVRPLRVFPVLPPPLAKRPESRLDH